MEYTNFNLFVLFSDIPDSKESVGSKYLLENLRFHEPAFYKESQKPAWNDQTPTLNAEHWIPQT